MVITQDGLDEALEKYDLEIHFLRMSSLSSSNLIDMSGISKNEEQLLKELKNNSGGSCILVNDDPFSMVVVFPDEVKITMSNHIYPNVRCMGGFLLQSNPTVSVHFDLELEYYFKEATLVLMNELFKNYRFVEG